MLRPGGTIIIGTPSSNAINHGFYSLSPTLFHDYFTANGFRNVSVYLRESSQVNYEKPGQLYRLQGTAATTEMGSPSHRTMEVFATKPRTTRKAYTTRIIQTRYATNPSWKSTKNPPPQTRTQRLLSWAHHHTKTWRPTIIDDTYLALQRARMQRHGDITYLGKY